MPTLVVEITAAMPQPDFGDRRKYRPLTKKLAFSPSQQLSIEFQKCEAMCARLHLDRAVTTLGFQSNTGPKRYLTRSSHSRSQRPLPDANGSRVKTAPGLLAKSSEAFENESHRKVDISGSDYIRDDKPAHISPDVLIEMLTERGVGSPRWYRYPPPPPEAAISRHYSGFRKVSYYMEKLKGQSRIDSEIANSKATAFCEEQRQVAHAQNRNPSAQFRSRFRNQPQDMFGDGRSEVGSGAGVNTQGDTAADRTDGSQNTEKIVYRRIKTWIEECELALDNKVTIKVASGTPKSK